MEADPLRRLVCALDSVRLAARPPGSSAAAGAVEFDRLLARIDVAVAALRGAAAGGDQARLAMRLVLSDVAAVTRMIRGRTGDLRETLDRAEAELDSVEAKRAKASAFHSSR